MRCLLRFLSVDILHPCGCHPLPQHYVLLHATAFSHFEPQASFQKSRKMEMLLPFIAASAHIAFFLSVFFLFTHVISLLSRVSFMLAYLSVIVVFCLSVTSPKLFFRAVRACSFSVTSNRSPFRTSKAALANFFASSIAELKVSSLLLQLLNTGFLCTIGARKRDAVPEWSSRSTA